MKLFVPLAVLFALALAAWAATPESMPVPKYNAAGEMIRPEGYREWIFVGSNLGMGYSEEPKKVRNYHNIYVQREAYRHYRDTGKFPDKTILVMENLTAGTKESINRTGTFEDKFIGIEVAVKDEAKFPEKWAYYFFFDRQRNALATAKPEPKASCWACHNANGAVDNVFVQFYPVLRELHPISGKH